LIRPERVPIDVRAAEVTDKADLPQLQAIIDALPNPVVAIDSGSIAIAANARARLVLPALRLQQPVVLALHAAELIEAIDRAIATGQPDRAHFSERVPVERWYEVHVIPVRLPTAAAGSGRTLLLLTFHDLTPLYRVEQVRADFVANASHELRTPLAAISGFIDTLQGPARDDPQAREKFLGIMQGQASRMARLIDDLLSLSRIELRAHVNPEGPADLVVIVRQVLDSLQTLAHERDVKLSLAAPVDPLTVRGDRDELTRLFENLVENALKYGASGKQVEVRVEIVRASDGAGQEAKIAVRDYGPGIAPENVPRLTERFYRVDVGQSRAEGGTGLGLALVKHILNRHRGRLAIDSKLGEGSTFTAYLPIS
jgi:two-component system, OmpR family, phosphate regulon sensor histidine kinase PhoR